VEADLHRLASGFNLSRSFESAGQIDVRLRQAPAEDSRAGQVLDRDLVPADCQRIEPIVAQLAISAEPSAVSLEMRAIAGLGGRDLPRIQQLTRI
jgi:hypothetical protein